MDSALNPLNSSPLERLHNLLSELKMAEASTLLESHLQRASQGDRSYADFLLDLLDAESRARKEERFRQALKRARLPTVKTLEQFDFGFQPSIDQSQIRELRTLRFVHEAGNVVFLGPPGVGKTHLAIALTVEAIRAGFSAQYITAHDLVGDLGKAAREGRLDRRLRSFVNPRVLVVDEMGYLPLDEVGATLFFQLVTARYEKGSILLTSNKSYGDWGKRLWRRSDGDSSSRPTATPRDHHKHPRRQLPHERKEKSGATQQPRKPRSRSQWWQQWGRGYCQKRHLKTPTKEAAKKAANWGIFNRRNGEF